jgi:gamma-glutamyl hercynylcysteine S-oxide synthase
VREGGYDDQSFWSDADWAWIKEQNIGHPRFGSSARTSGSIGPCLKSCRCRSTGRSMSATRRPRPMRVLWQVPSHRSPVPSRRLRNAGRTERAYPWGDAPPDAGRGNFDFQRWDPVAVGSYPAAAALSDWRTLSATAGNGPPLTLRPSQALSLFPFIAATRQDFFDGKHFVVKGASPRTAACMLRRSFRNWFQPHYPFVYASFRCVSN